MKPGILGRDPDVVAAELDGEPRLLHLRSWTYLALNPVGERIWALLAEPREPEAVLSDLLAEFEGDEAEIRADLEGFLARLEEQGFLARA